MKCEKPILALLCCFLFLFLVAGVGSTVLGFIFGPVSLGFWAQDLHQTCIVGGVDYGSKLVAFLALQGFLLTGLFVILFVFFFVKLRRSQTPHEQYPLLEDSQEPDDEEEKNESSDDRDYRVVIIVLIIVMFSSGFNSLMATYYIQNAHCPNANRLVSHCHSLILAHWVLTVALLLLSPLYAFSLAEFVRTKFNRIGRACATTSTASGEGVSNANAQLTAYFTVQVRDYRGNRRRVGGDAVAGAVYAGSLPVSCVVEDQHDGTYVLSYIAPDESGVYKLSVTLYGEDIVDSPFTVRVQGVPDELTTLVCGEGTVRGFSGSKSEFVIRTFDKDGHAIPVGGYAAHATLTAPSGEGVPVEVMDNGDGKYTLWYTPTEVGDHRLVPSVMGIPLRSGPYTVFVSLGHTFPSKCQASGEILRVGHALLTSSFTIQSYGKLGNKIGTGGDPFVTVMHADEDPSDKVLVGQMEDHEDGHYTVALTPVRAGPHSISVTVGDEHIQGSPFACQVISAPNPSFCTVSGPGLSKATSGHEADFVLHTFDDNGSPLTVGGYNVMVSVTSSTGVERAATVGDNSDGTYHVLYRPIEVGRTAINVYVQTLPINGTPFIVEVSPGNTDLSLCDVQCPRVINADRTAEVVVRFDACDGDRNIELLESEKLAVVLKGGSSDVPAVVCSALAPNGYVVDLTAPDEAGPRELHVTVNGSPVKNSPFAVTVLSSPSRAHSTLLMAATKGVAAGSAQEAVLTTCDSLGARISVGGYTVAARLTCPNGEVRAAAVSDVGDGTYVFKFTPTRVGPHTLEALVGTLPLDGPGVSFDVLPGAAAAAQCTCEGSGLHRANASKPASFVLKAADSFGNRLSVGGTSFSVDVRYSEHKATVTDNCDGTYQVDYVAPPNGGKYDVGVTLLGQHVHGSPFPCAVQSAPCAATSLLDGVEHARGVAVVGAKQTFLLATKCDQDQPIALGGYNVTASLSQSGGEALEATVEDNGDGTYAISVTPTMAGTVGLTVLLSDEPLRGSPFEFGVKPGELCAAQCTVSGEGVEKAHALLPAEFVVHPRDKYGNAITTTSPHFAVKVFSKDNKSYSGKVTRGKEGTSRVVYVVADRAGGAHSVHVTLDGRHVRGSPFHCLVQSAPSPKATVPVGTLPTTAVAGTRVSWQFALQDDNGDAITVPGYSATASAVLPDGSEKELTATVDGGNMEVVAALVVAGRNQIFVSAAGCVLECSPLVFDVTPGPVDGSKCAAEGTGLHLAQSEEWEKFTIHARDAYGNHSSNTAAAFTAVMHGASPTAVTVVDEGEGRFAATYVGPEVDGTYTIAVTYADVPIPGSPFQLVVACAAKAHGPMCTMCGRGCKGCFVNKPSSLVVTARTKRGDPVTKGGDTVTATVAPESQPQATVAATVTDNGDGTYSVEYGGHDVGRYLLCVLANGEHVSGSPATVWSIPAEEESVIEAAFKKYDASGDSAISQAEFALLMDDVGAQCSFKQKLDLFNETNDDGSEEIDLFEFTSFYLSYWHNLPPRMPAEEADFQAVEWTVEDEEIARAAFNKFAEDGSLLESHFALLLEDLGCVIRKKDREALFASIDTDGGGAISYDEFENWWYNFSGRESRVIDKDHPKPSTWNDEMEKALRNSFNKYDPNGDGSLSVLEFGMLLEDMGVKELKATNIIGLYEQVDADGAGGITFDEFRSWFVVFQTIRSI